MFGTHQSEWYTREQIRVIFYSKEVFSSEELNEILNQLYPMKTTPIIGGKKFTMPVLETVYVKK
jgi:hypothetical protein